MSGQSSMIAVHWWTELTNSIARHLRLRKKNVQLQQNLDDHFYGEPIELTGGKTGGDGHAKVSTIVKRVASFELHIVWG